MKVDYLVWGTCQSQVAQIASVGEADLFSSWCFGPLGQCFFHGGKENRIAVQIG